MKPNPNAPIVKLRVMCDFSADGIWDLTNGFGVSCSDLNVPYWLEIMFEEWQQVYELTAPDYNRVDTNFDAINHDRNGLALAHKLLQYLPTGSEVWYFHESSTPHSYGALENVQTGVILTTPIEVKVLVASCNSTE